MKIPSDDTYNFLDESIEINTEQERKLLAQFLDYFNKKEKNNKIEELVINILNKLFENNKFHLQLIDRNDPKEKDISKAYGFYSAYENNIYIIIDKSNFEKKWFGFQIDYNTLNNIKFDIFINTCVHELMHYACTNYYIQFIKIWRSLFRQYVWNVFSNVINYYFSDFVDSNTFTNIAPKKFIENISFKKAYDVYFNSLIINIRFKLSSLSKRYNDVLSTLYSQQPFEYARFFDNVLINAIKLQNGTYSDSAIKLYNCIHKAYIDIEPVLKDIKMNELFYQEILDFSEIACVLASYYNYNINHIGLIENTLNLIY